MTTPCVVGTIGRHGADVFAHGDLPQQVWQNWAVAVSAGCKLHRPDVGGGGIHRQMDLAPLAAALNTVLAGLPFTVIEELDPGAVHEQVKRPIDAPIWDLDGQRLLPSAKRRVIRHLPIQTRHLEQAGHHPGCLPEWQLEQHLDRQAELDRRVRKDWWPPWSPLMRREPGHTLIQLDQQRSALSERGIVARPVGRAVAGGVRLAHAIRLTNWIRDVNPLPSEFCNNALWP
jgi:hypothetical protein